MATVRHRVLVTKLGLDGHDRGIRLLARELRDRGLEVVYLGVGTTPATAAVSAIEEDVDVIAVSLLSGAHRTLVVDLMSELARHDVEIPVVCGGLIPPEDQGALEAAGVTATYSIGISVTQAAQAIHDIAAGGRESRP